MKMMMDFLGLGTAIAISAAAMAAETPPAKDRPMSLADCVQAALQRNLEVKVQRMYPQYYQYQVNVAYGGYDPTFNLGGQHDFTMSPSGIDPSTQLSYTSSSTDKNSYSSSLSGSLPTGTTYSLSGGVNNSYGVNSGTWSDTSAGSASITLTQPLLKNFWIDDTRLKISLSKKDLKNSELELAYTIMKTALSVEQAYYDLIYAQEYVVVQKQARELADRLLAENKKKVEVGTMAPLDEKQAESQVATYRANVILAEQNLAQQQNVLKILIHDNFSELANINILPTDSLNAIPQAFSLQDSWHRGLTQRPDLAKQRIELERQDIQLKYARNQLYPELDLVGSYGHLAGGNTGGYVGSFDQLSDGSSPTYYYGAKLSIPLTNRRARNNLKATKTQKEQVLLTLKIKERDIMAAIDNDIKQAKANYEQVDARKQARIYAEAALDAEQKKLEAGKSTSYFVLQSQRDLTTARGNEIQAKADYRKSLAQLSFDDASICDRQGISLNTK